MNKSVVEILRIYQPILQIITKEDTFYFNTLPKDIQDKLIDASNFIKEDRSIHK